MTDPPIRYSEMVEPLPDGPIELAALVEQAEGPLELDVGYGRGRSLLARAAARPDVRIIGVEVKTKWAYKVEARRKRRGLTNARALCGDVREIVARAVPDACLSRVFVHFPDPWWKKRHQKRMVVTDDFLDALARLVRPGGEVFVQTDVEERAEEYRALLHAHPAFAPAGDRGHWLDRNPFEGRSNREVRAEEDGLPVYRLLAKRVETPDPPSGA